MLPLPEINYGKRLASLRGWFGSSIFCNGSRVILNKSLSLYSKCIGPGTKY